MSTYREIVYLIQDELKLISDDSVFQLEHIMFLIDKYRSFVLKKSYTDIKKEIPESNYQTICLDLEQQDSFEGDTCGGKGYLKSVQKIPNMLSIGNTKVSPMDYFAGDITYVNRERFKYVGNNSYLQNIIYSTLAPDEHLYIKSNNPQAYYLEKVKVTGIFEDSSKAAELACDSEDLPCDVLDRNFPMEEGLIPTMIELVLKELGGAIYKPADDDNDASDALSRIANYLARNLKKNWERDGESAT